MLVVSWKIGTLYTSDCGLKRNTTNDEIIIYILSLQNAKLLTLSLKTLASLKLFKADGESARVAIFVWFEQTQQNFV